MGLSEGIRRIGFRRWYERQLIESHVYLVTCFLCLVAALACFEEFSWRLPAWELALRFVAMFAGGAVCVWTAQRYLSMLFFALGAAEHSVCEKCGAYRGLELSGAALHRHGAEDEEDNPPPVGVRCRKCGHEWVIG